MSKTRCVAALGAAICVIAVVAGCNDNDLGLEKRRPNQPPQTILSSGPPDSTTGANYRVHLYWAGSDPDGTIDHFDYIMIDHPAADDDISPDDPNAPNRVVVRVPDVNDPRWSSTFANDTLVVTRADTLRHGPPVSSAGNDSLRQTNFERWHTFFVRAVDNEGLLDDTPEYRSFNSTTIAPVVFLKPPVNPALEEFSGPTTIVFNWDGVDDVGDGTTLAPIASRWTYLPTRKTTTLDYVGYPDTFYTLPPSAWSPWRQWDARDRSGTQAIIRNLIPVQAGGGYYMFAVQAMDEAGAVTPVFDAHTAGKNNVAKIFVNDAVGATLVVNERFLGSFNFVGSRAEPVVLPIAAGQPINFTWRGDASSYGGEIVAYRYGWNIRNPSNDEEWQQNWCQNCRVAPTRVFNSGAQRFFLETRDNAETITHAEFELVVYQVTKNRDLLFVDDTSYPPDAPEENFEDRRWASVIDALVARRPFQYDRAIDSYDVEANRRVAPPLPLVFDYKSIIWASRAYTTENALKKIAFFIDPFDTRRQTQTVLFNYLNVYIDNGGEFFLSGDEVSSILWPFAARNPFPANITNWDDPVQPQHPERDSVGTIGFLWKMGVEAVDEGSGPRAPEPRGEVLLQGCISFARATPEGFEQQTFVSSTNAAHRHELEIPTADVDQSPGDRTYTTELVESHTHDVTLTEAQLDSLAQGERVTVTTTESASPVPHVHTFTLFDQVGLWGGPAQLMPDTNQWPLPPIAVNPFGGRSKIEIYNMPNYMAIQQPPLNPPPDIWVPLYTFKSLTPQDLNATPPVLYPGTADLQPSILLRRANRNEPQYSRAICGFEPWRLQMASHVALADFIMLRHFRLGLVD